MNMEKLAPNPIVHLHPEALCLRRARSGISAAVFTNHFFLAFVIAEFS